MPEADPHKAMSNLIQGGVAEVVRVAISRLYPAVCELGGRMLMQVHDSVIFEVPDDALAVALPTFKLIMEDFEFDPPMGVDVEYGKSWGTFRKWDPKEGLPEATGGHGTASEGLHRPEDVSDGVSQERSRDEATGGRGRPYLEVGGPRGRADSPEGLPEASVGSIQRGAQMTIFDVLGEEG